MGRETEEEESKVSQGPPPQRTCPVSGSGVGLGSLATDQPPQRAEVKMNIHEPIRFYTFISGPN